MDLVEWEQPKEDLGNKGGDKVHNTIFYVGFDEQKHTSANRWGYTCGREDPGNQTGGYFQGELEDYIKLFLDLD